VPAPVELLSRLLWIRDAAALPDRAVADLLEEEPRVLTTLVNAHPERFAEALVFRLSGEERAQIPEAPVLAFTEAGLALLVGLLPGKDPAILALLPQFARARHLLTSQAELSARVSALEEKLGLLLQEQEEAPVQRPIGFVNAEDLPRRLKDKSRTGRKPGTGGRS